MNRRHLSHTATAFVFFKKEMDHCVPQFSSSCRRDDFEAALFEEKRLCRRPRGQRETLALRPLAKGTADTTGVQLLQVNALLFN